MVSALSFARPSAAEPTAQDRTRLAELVRKGEQATKAQDWKGCVDALWDALAIEDSARIAGDLALCEEQLGRFGDAVNHVRRALGEATPAMRKREPWRTYQEALSRMRSQVATVAVFTDPVDAYIIVDGRPQGKAGHLIAVNIGKRHVVARKEGYEDASETRLMTPGGLPVIHLKLTPKPRPEPAAVPATPVPVTPVPAATVPRPALAAPRRGAEPASLASFPCLPARSVPGVLMPLACVTTAAFAASAATAIGLEVHASSMRASLTERGAPQTACAPGQPGAASPECTDLRARFRQRTDAANVMIGTGIAAAVLAAGAGLSVALAPKGPKVTATASPAGGGVFFHGQW